MQTIFFILQTLCVAAIGVVLRTVGCGIQKWQWWAIMLILLIYTILLAIED